MRSKREDSKLSAFKLVVLQKLAEIESRLAVLEKGDADEDESDVSALDGLSMIPALESGKRRRKSKLPLKELTSRRNRIIQLLEPRCPEIIERLRDARNETEAANAVQLAVADSPIKPGFLQYPQQCAGQLWSFIKSGRFHGNLRNLANAMAGVPEMSWKRSFDVCIANPPNPPIPMHYRAYRDFLSRNFPERLRELDSAQTPEEVTKILAKSRSKDPHYLALRAEPERVLDWLRDGRINSAG
jgi:hypothetical protein